MNAPTFLPYGRQTIDDEDVAAVEAVLRSDYLTTGPAVEAFEAELVATTGALHAVAVNSGTAGLHAVTLAMGLGPGDWTIVPAITFAATANAVRYVGAEVQFADVDPDTGLLTPATLEAAFADARARGRSIKAVFPVHLAGQPVDLPAIKRLADAHDVQVVEDACHAIGGSYTGGDGETRPIGDARYSLAAVFSFHPVKTITSGEGGAITSRSDSLVNQARMARSHGIVRDAAGMRFGDLAMDDAGRLNPWYYEIHELGLNYRLSDINAALGKSQLTKLSRFVSRRRAIADLYEELLRPLANSVRPIPRAGHGHSAWHLYPILIDFAAVGRSRSEIMRALSARSIGTQVHYIPVPWLPAYAGRPGTEADLAGARAYYERTLSIPIFPALSDDDVRRVVGALTAELGCA